MFRYLRRSTQWCERYPWLPWCRPKPVPVHPPIADAGPDQAVLVGSAVDISGAGSSSEQGRPLAYRWKLTAPAGSRAVLSSSQGDTTRFLADKQGTYIVSLSVREGTMEDSDVVEVVATTDEPPPPPPPTPMPPTNGRVLLAERDLERLSTETEGYRQVRGHAIKTTPYGDVHHELFVPWAYGRDSKEHYRRKNALRKNFRAALANALVAVILNDDESAENAITILDAWARLPSISARADSQLVFAYTFPSAIVAANLIHNSFSWAGESLFARMLETVAITVVDALGKEDNNRASWGVCLKSFLATYLDRAVWLDESEAAFEEAIKRQVFRVGGRVELPNETSRGDKGISYSNFSLMALTLAAQNMQAATGRNWYSFSANDGCSLVSAWETVSEWMVDPSTYPYHSNPRTEPERFSYSEILLTDTYNHDADAYCERHRPMSAFVAVPFLSFLFGG